MVKRAFWLWALKGAVAPFVRSKRRARGGLRLRAGALGARLAFAPQLLEVVVLPDRRLHDVDDDVAEVDQNPLAGGLALGAVHLLAERLRLLLHAARERLGLARRVGGGDDHAVEQAGKVGDVECCDVARLDVLERGDHCLLLLADVHQAVLPSSALTTRGSKPPRAPRSRESAAYGVGFTPSRAAAHEYRRELPAGASNVRSHP